MQKQNILEKTFTCKREQLNIHGMYFLPETYVDGRQYPTIIFSHGFGGNYTDMISFCKTFVAQGYVTFCFSFCGGTATATDSSLKSDGETTDMTIYSEVADLAAVKDFALQQEFVDSKQLILAGFSQGGFVSGITAAKYNDEISKLIMVYPALCIPDHARRGCLGGANYDINHVPAQLQCPTIVVGKKFHDEVITMDPYLELAPYKGPVLILQGLNDTIVNYSYAIKAKEHYTQDQCHLQLIKEMGHGFHENQSESLVASMRQFLLNRQEILSIQVFITHCDQEVVGDIHKNDIYFTGYCDTPYFRGTILPDGCDSQEYRGDECLKIRAEYTLDGLDNKEQRCQIHVVNQRGTIDWEPVIDTNSGTLSWLNDTDLTAVLEHSKEGPMVRIFAPRK